MQYADKPEFITILQRALEIASAKHTDAEVLKLANIAIDRTSLHRFKKGLTAQFSTLANRTKLWRFLNDHDFVKDALAGKGHDTLSDKSQLMNVHEVALAATCFFNTHDSQIMKLVRAGIRGLYYGHKNAFRLPNSITKSLFRIDTTADDHIIVHEYQRSSGRYDPDHMPSEERSEGFGISKSDKLWLFLREFDFEQPRIFCFSEFKSSIIRNAPHAKNQRAPEVITQLMGHCLESSRKFKDDVFYSKIILTRLPYDDSLTLGGTDTFWKRHASRLDLFPIPDSAADIKDPEQAPIHPAIIRMLNGS